MNLASFQVIPLVASVGFFVACGDGSHRDKEPKKIGDISIADPLTHSDFDGSKVDSVTTEGIGTEFPRAFDGQSDCRLNKIGQPETYRAVWYRFNGYATLRVERRLFRDSDQSCHRLSIALVQYETGEFPFSGVENFSSPKLRLKSVLFSPPSDEFSAVLNANGICRGSWLTGLPQNVTDCEFVVKPQRMISTPEIDFGEVLGEFKAKAFPVKETEARLTFSAGTGRQTFNIAGETVVLNGNKVP